MGQPGSAHRERASATVTGNGVNNIPYAEIVVTNDLRSAKEPEERILAEVQRCGYDPDTIFAIKLAFEEAITNAVKHGNRNDKSKQITIRYHIDHDRVILAIRDQGQGFAPETVPDPTLAENLERPCGRGLMLIRSYMTEVRYDRNGTEVWMMKERPRQQT